MHRRKKFRFLVFGLAAITLVMMLSGNGQHAAWMQGYASGIAAAGGDAATLAPMMAHHGFHGGLGIIGGLIKGIFHIGFFLLMFAFFAKLFGLLMWRLSSRADGGPWGHRFACEGGHQLGGESDGGFDRWSHHDKWRQKWQEKKRAWAEEVERRGGSSKENGEEDRPDEERFVV